MSDEFSTSRSEDLSNSEGRTISNLNLRVGQPKGPMWPLLRYDMKKAFKIGSKISHMVTCIGYVLYSQDSQYSSSPSRVYMIDSIVKSNETYDAQIHDPMYDLKDDWAPRNQATNTKSKQRGKNVFGSRGLTHIGTCTLVNINSAHTSKIIDHLLNQCPFKEKLKEKYPLQISRLLQSVIDCPPPRKKRISNNSCYQEYQAVSTTELDQHDATKIVVTTSSKCEFPSAPPTNEQTRIIEDLACKFAVQLSMPEDGFELDVDKQFISTISPHCPMPTAHRLRNVIIPRLYQMAKLEVENSVKNWKSAQIAVDTWIDPSRRSVTYASLLRSFSDPALRFDEEELEICNTLYDHIYAPSESRDHEYDGIQMLQWAQTISERLNTPVVSFICDGDATILKGARYARSLFSSKSDKISPFIIRCSAHLLNLLCHDVITVLGAKQLIQQASNISGYFRRVGEENGGLPKKMASMTDVRWNSAYDLLESVIINRHHIHEYSKRKKLPSLISDAIVNNEFRYGVLKLLEVIKPICIALDIVQSDSIKFGENIGVIVAIAFAIRQSYIKEVEQFRVITKCEARLNLLIREDPNSEKIGFCLHATAYFCHPGFRGCLLSTDLEFKMIAEDGLKMLLARRQREGSKVTETDATELFGMWTTTASLERVFSMGKQLAPPQKSRLKVSTTASHLLIKTHYMLVYREKCERCRFSKRVPIDFDASCSLNEILEELDVEESTAKSIFH